jgi:MoaA/NifB/PqqE/SkfB family radical SAM enzyme
MKDDKVNITHTAPERSSFFEWRNLAVSLTSCCNLRCKMCPVVNRAPHSLSREQAMDIAEFASSRKVAQVVVGGGEPTLMAYFWEFMDALAQGGVEIWLLTNAYRLTPEQIDRLAAYPKFLANVSVDGVGPVHDAIRGAGTFDATTGNIQRMLDRGCRVAVNTVIQRSNFRTVPEIHDWFSGHPLEWHGFQYAEYKDHAEFVPPEDLPESFDILERLVQRVHGKPNHLSLSMDMIRAYRIWSKYPKLLAHPGLACTIPRRQIIIAENGLVAPCWHYDWPLSDGVYLANRSLAEIVDSPEYRALVEHMIGPNGCAGCTTMCYCWDDDFQRKLFHPPLGRRIERDAMLFKQYMIGNHPELTAWISRLRHKIIP